MCLPALTDQLSSTPAITNWSSRMWIWRRSTTCVRWIQPDTQTGKYEAHREISVHCTLAVRFVWVCLDLNLTWLKKRKKKAIIHISEVLIGTNPDLTYCQDLVANELLYCVVYLSLSVSLFMLMAFADGQFLSYICGCWPCLSDCCLCFWFYWKAARWLPRLEAQLYDHIGYQRQSEVTVNCMHPLLFQWMHTRRMQCTSRGINQIFGYNPRQVEDVPLSMDCGFANVYERQYWPL